MITLSMAIGRMEGFGAQPNNRPTRNNNPGDLEYGPFAIKHGAQRGDPRFAVFATVAQGYNALRDLLMTHYSHLTVRQMVFEYAPPNENNSEFYLKEICEWVGCKPIDLVANIIDGVPSAPYIPMPVVTQAQFSQQVRETRESLPLAKGDPEC
jgi:hypothetical protein